MSDINEHLPTLFGYAKECESIIEMGVRGVVSTWALLMSRPKKMESWDINFDSGMKTALDEAYKENIDFKFIIADTTKATSNEVDLLFIDTKHNYEQLKIELNLHGKNTKKYIIFHDTVTFGYRDEFGDGKGLMPAIREFIKENPYWIIKEHYLNNNGLLILEKSV